MFGHFTTLCMKGLTIVPISPIIGVWQSRKYSFVVDKIIGQSFHQNLNLQCLQKQL